MLLRYRVAHSISQPLKLAVQLPLPLSTRPPFHAVMQCARVIAANAKYWTWTQRLNRTRGAGEPALPATRNFASVVLKRVRSGGDGRAAAWPRIRVQSGR